MSKSVSLTESQQATLAQIKQEQSWAEAQEFNRVLDGDSSFHTLHRDSALRERDKLLSGADPKVVKAFRSYMRRRLVARKCLQERIAVLTEKLLAVRLKKQEIDDARAVSWRNYRSRCAHAHYAGYVQAIASLTQERNYLQSKYDTNLVLWP